ncbi:unnamed protein product [Phytophthora fragariaefolia]|uniref:Unnamed protein product n=1 Tax=Phytophthora fragariaefolia TaxID=1490495 RepID=A0A9W6XE09_9STRA|nr:unnamed protein product [Phytophthora fragariaefolia]
MQCYDVRNYGHGVHDEAEAVQRNWVPSVGSPGAWGAQVKVVLEIKGLWADVEREAPSADGLATEAERLRVYSEAVAAGTSGIVAPLTPLHDQLMRLKMASSIILSALTEKLAAEVYLFDHPLAMLRHLRLTYNVKCSASVGAAKREYMSLYLADGDSMTEHIKTTKRVIGDLQEQRVLLSDEEKRQNFMQSLGPSWNGFVGVLEICQTFEAMVTRYQAEAIRRDQQKNRRSTNGGGKSNAAFSAEQAAGKKGGKKKRDMTKVKCYNCQEMGHFARDCTKDRVPPKSKGGEAASVAFSVDDAAEDCKRGWIVDSGATSHMTGHVDNLVSVRELEEPRVLTVASGDSLVATAMGQAPLYKHGKEVCVLQEVLYVRGLARNLVSVGAASRRGMTVEFRGVGCAIRTSNGVTIQASRESSHMYVLEAVSKPGEDAAMMTSAAPHVETWHRRLGHLNVQSPEAPGRAEIALARHGEAGVPNLRERQAVGEAVWGEGEACAEEEPDSSRNRLCGAYAGDVA